jgi:hypothetical protein
MQTSRVEMNYLKTYCNLIRKAEKRGYTKKKAKEQGLYVEGHHIFPKSIFGMNNIIVYLTAREHYIAHALLEKIYIKRYGMKDWRTHKMTSAHIFMKSKNKYYNSYLYENAKIRNKNNMKNSKVLKESGKKIAAKNKENKNGIFSLTSKQLSENGKKGGKIGGKTAGKKCYENKLGAFSLSEEERYKKNSKGGKIGGKNTYEKGVGIFSRSREKMMEDIRKASEASKNIKYRCLVTGKITNSGALTCYQRKRGIDKSLRVKIDLTKLSENDLLKLFEEKRIFDNNEKNKKINL